MKSLKPVTKLAGQSGASLLFILFIILLVLLVFFGIDQAYIFVKEDCQDESMDACFGMLLHGDQTQMPADAVRATGSVSGDWGGEKRTLNVSMQIPLSGGGVTGSFSGDCSGKIKGRFSAGDGTISGTGEGSCGFIIPASGSFSGSVNEADRTVPISGSGSAAGFSGSGSITLEYSQ